MTACPSLNVTDANKLCLVSNACQAFLKMLQAMLDCCSRVSKFCLNNNCYSNQSVPNISWSMGQMNQCSVYLETLLISKK